MITATNTTCPITANSVATSNYLPTASSTTAPGTSDGDSVPTCHHRDHTLTSHIGLDGHLRMHRTAAGKLVPGVPKHSRDHTLQRLHCPRAFIHRMGLLSHMCIHESGIHCDAGTSCAPIKTFHIPLRSLTTSTRSIAPADSAPLDLSYPHWHHTCTSRIGQIVHLRIHRTETGEPLTEAPTYTRHTRLNCPHCPRTFRHGIGLLGHMHLHENLR
ncbi:unnamed protein product [Schistocephalus solidus]|uniref:C2H2-type domain-containing protein n=1 Tax=Schistocephalus solidus TaxID=70667 RepID=A0A183SW82_SCHSO|nr:unnamed protein product [Schistocephalus solidus]